MLSKPVTVIRYAVGWILLWLTSPQLAHFLGESLFWLLGLRRKGREIDLSQAKRVLALRLDEVGDVVMTTPFLRELRRNLPDAWITLVVKPAIYNLVELCPFVNEVLTFDWATQGRFWQLQLHSRALKFSWNHLWRRRFDLAIVPRWDIDYYHSSFVAYFSGAPWRVGYSENIIDHKRVLNRGVDRLFTHMMSNNTVKHEVEHNLDVIRFLGGKVKEDNLEMWLGPEDEMFAEQILRSHGAHNGDLLIAFAPGAGAPKRVWPIANFTELGQWFSREYYAKIIVVGGRGEELLGQELQQKLGNVVINMVGQSTLRQTWALIKRCNIFVGNDAGPMHLAAAAGVPVIEVSCHPRDGSLLHPNSPHRFRPWIVPNRVLQPEKALDPCSEACISTQAHCILGINVGHVKEAVKAMLSEQGCNVVVKSVLSADTI